MEPLNVDKRADKTYLEGTFIDLNKNDIKYDLDSVLSQIREIQMDVANGNFLGEIGHPDRNEVSLSNVSHRITSLWVDPMKRELNGKLEILQTPKGIYAQKLIDSGVPLYVASRATGRTNEKGEIELDKLYSFDLIHENMEWLNDLSETTGLINNDLDLHRNVDPNENDLYANLYNAVRTDATTNFKSAPPPPPIPKSNERRELLVFAVYLNAGVQSEAKTRTRMAEIKGILHSTFEDVEKYTNYLIKFMIFPIREGETRMECVFPKSQDNIDLSSLILSEEKVKGFTVGEENDPEDFGGRKGDMFADHRTQALLRKLKDKGRL